MKKNNLLQGAIVALLVASPFMAYADSQYPATDFEPKVLYQDESIKASTPTAAVVKTAPVAATVSADDSQYPATNFQPKVLFSDASYKHDKSAPSIAQEFTTSAGAVIMEQASEKKAAQEDDNSLFLLLGGLVVAGFAASRCPKFAGVFGGGVASDDSSAYANRETGVTRYLNSRIPKVSGVTKYLERAGKPTNVARYIAKQNIAQKATQNDTDRG